MGETGGAVPIAELLDERRHLLDVAHWMLGTAPGAEDAVTETYRRWYALTDARRAAVAEPRAWLTRTTGIICLARLARPGRASPGRLSPEHLSPGHPSPGLPSSRRPSPARTGSARTGSAAAGGGAGRPARPPDPALTEEISGVLLDALATLSPAERAAFVLNDVFAMPPRAVAGIVGRSPRACAELADRARHSLRAGRARPTADREHDSVVRAVRRACATADTTGLAALLAPDATALFDGGGKVRALTRPVRGKHHVTRTLLTLLALRPRTTLHLRRANGRTAIVVRHRARTAAVISFDVSGHQVTEVWAVLNPDKLRAWNRSRFPVDERGPRDG
ncbi:RNA polymerase subunit sigma [Streptomyces sp. ISL-12]|uniref:sigma factor-like helix-turn-helix DNA-binding protein n=1 Tax=Streptomyces sp. ISL-12 TaxID=2819177 RepID=UPI001BEA0452|nr:sigma factor-like helix-turn-helix DNA-binding protein [Streptomyces sp. ISL-12]MBT2409019.1 RNA polymerase subunit sigma [Streptomyces sp. ISL-12]